MISTFKVKKFFDAETKNCHPERSEGSRKFFSRDPSLALKMTVYVIMEFFRGILIIPQCFLL